MKIMHICAGWQKWNGAANIARMIMDEQRREGHEVSFATWAKVRDLRAADEVWIHCGWLPCLWWAALWARNARWMPEACYDPIRLKFSAWKKRLAGPIERWSLRRCKKLVATCDAEKEWIEAYLGKRCPEIVVEDVKRFFDLAVSSQRLAVRGQRLAVNGGEVGPCRSGECVDGALGVSGEGNFEPCRGVEGESLAVRGQELGDRCLTHKKLNVLYLGRMHPLKGVEFLEAAVSELNSSTPPLRTPPLLKIVSNAFGDELEKVWDWCDVLVLPTLSDNFGLVVAEALERGKRVITTDGAPVWESLVVSGQQLAVRGQELGARGQELVVSGDGCGIGVGCGGRLLYLKGYRDGTDLKRVELLKKAIAAVSRDVMIKSSKGV